MLTAHPGDPTVPSRQKQQRLLGDAVLRHTSKTVKFLSNVLKKPSFLTSMFIGVPLESDISPGNHKARYNERPYI